MLETFITSRSIETFYIAGLNSKNEESNTYIRLLEKIPNLKLIKYDINNFKSESELISYVRNEILKISEVSSIFDRCVIGNSLGARISYQLSDIAYYLVLVNIPLYLKVDRNVLFNENYIFNDSIINNNSLITHILSKYDDLVDIDRVIEDLNNSKLRGDFVIIDDTHFLNKSNSINLIYNTYNKNLNIMV